MLIKAATLYKKFIRPPDDVLSKQSGPTQNMGSAQDCCWLQGVNKQESQPHLACEAAATCIRTAANAAWSILMLYVLLGKIRWPSCCIQAISVIGFSHLSCASYSISVLFKIHPHINIPVRFYFSEICLLLPLHFNNPLSIYSSHNRWYILKSIVVAAIPTALYNNCSS